MEAVVDTLLADYTPPGHDSGSQGCSGQPRGKAPAVAWVFVPLLAMLGLLALRIRHG